MILSKCTAQAALGICTALLLGSVALAQSALPGQAPGQTPGEAMLVKRPAQLREAPAESSRSLQALPVQTSMTRLGERQGPWIKALTADGSTGWVHMFDVTSANSGAQANPVASAGAGAMRGITNFFNRGSAQQPGSSVATSTLGIRGLGVENLANAQPDIAAVAQAEALRINAVQAKQFAVTAALASRPVDALPAVKTPSPPARSPDPSGASSISGG